MRSWMLWRSAVLASLALLMSGQLCMLTTCVRHMQRAHMVSQHACCRATPERPTPSHSQHATGTMPCDVVLQTAQAPVLGAASALTVPTVLMAAATATLAPPARVATPLAEADTGPPHERISPAPAGLRAPPQG